MRFLQIVVKNTSELDFSLPLLWKLKKDYDVDIDVLYCALSKNQFLRDSKFFSDTLNSSGIRELDFASFLRAPFALVSALVRDLFSVGYSDLPPLRPALDRFKKSIGRRGMWRAFRELMIVGAGNLERPAQKFVERAVQSREIFPTLAPDLVLLGNRTRTMFRGREHMYRYFDHVRKPVVLLPHGTHEVHPVKEFIPFNEKGPALTSYCDFWSAFQETPWINTPGQEHLYANVGYPGLDQEWIDFAMANRKSRDSGPLVCALILRKILPKWYTRPANYDPFTLDYAEMLGYLNRIADAAAPYKGQIEFVIKPHPSNNFELLSQILEESRLGACQISSEPFYQVIPKIDFAISLFSTSLLLPAMYGLPVVVLDTPLQQYVHNRWPLLDSMYSGLRFFAKDQSALEAAVRKIVEVPSVSDDRADVLHLRKYYPDGSLTVCLNRIEKLLGRELRRKS